MIMLMWFLNHKQTHTSLPNPSQIPHQAEGVTNLQPVNNNVAIDKPKETILSSPKPIMSDEDFINGEVSFAQEQLKGMELGFCEAPTQKICSSDNKDFCITMKKYCLPENNFIPARDEELLIVLSPESIISNQIEIEKLENYIKDPVNNGSDMYDNVYYDNKLRQLTDFKFQYFSNQ